MERPQEKLGTEGSAPKRIQLKKKNLSQLDNGTATRQARNSRHCPEKETIKKKKTLSHLDNGTATRQANKQQAVPRKGDNKRNKKNLIHLDNGTATRKS